MSQINPGQAGNTMSNSKKFFKNGMRKSFNLKPKKFKETITKSELMIDDSTHKVAEVMLFVKLDKNGAICDCTRVGRSLDILRGRQFYKKYDYANGVFGYIFEEIRRLHKNEYTITIDKGVVTEIQ